jgi:hypothetical protein
MTVRFRPPRNPRMAALDLCTLLESGPSYFAVQTCKGYKKLQSIFEEPSPDGLIGGFQALHVFRLLGLLLVLTVLALKVL